MLKNKFYLVNVKTKIAFNKPFNTAKRSYKLIEIEKKQKGFILIDKIKGFENVISLKLCKYPNVSKKIKFTNNINDLKEN